MIDESAIWKDAEYVVAEKENGQTFEISPDYGCRLIEFDDGSPEIDAYSESIEGRDRVEFLGNRLSRPVSLEFLIYDENPREILRKVNRFFSKDQIIFLRHSPEFGFRFVCQVQSIVPEKRNRKIIKVRIDFLCQNPTKESVDIFEFNYPEKIRTLDGSWLLDGSVKLDGGMRVPFFFDPDSDVELDPRAFFLELEFRGESKNLIIQNETTGDIFNYAGTTKKEDYLLITGSKVLLNGKSVIRETNKTLINFAPGENVLRVQNFTSFFKLTIRFRKQQF